MIRQQSQQKYCINTYKKVGSAIIKKMDNYFLRKEIDL